MRKTGLAVALIAVAVVVQLSVLNGLRLPGGGVPDLVLVLVAALAMANGPVPGMIIGFAAGLCLDLAPPASQLIGQYALVFCLAGWAAGRLGAVATRSALGSTALLAIVVVGAEALTAVLGLALEPAQVTMTDVRQVLPSAIAYDLLILPFAVYLVLAASSLVEDGLAGPASVRSALTAPARGRSGSPQGSSRQGISRQGSGRQGSGRRGRPHEPRLAPSAGRPGDGWLGSAPHGVTGRYGPARPPARRHPVRLRPANGVAGSASGLARGAGAMVPSVNLRLTGGRRGDGVIGDSVGNALGRHPKQQGRHPGLLAGTGRGFRPHGGEMGGSASGQRLLSRAAAPARNPAPIKFAGRRRDASVGRALGHTGLGDPHRAAFSPAPRLSVRPRAVPKIRFGGGQAKRAARRQAAEPRFRRQSGRLRPAAASGLVAGGVLDQSTFRAIRRQRGMPRLRFGRTRRGSGMIGGSGRAPHPARPAAPRFRIKTAKRRRGTIGKQPRFGYGKRSVLSVLSKSRVGGRWLAGKRVGTRSGVWVLSRRTGGTR